MAEMTGGCQCGAVRYELASLPSGGTLCHCRMCQKAVGGPFMVSLTVPAADFRVARGTVATFRSSSAAERGFCAACGTPLTFRYLDQNRISVTLGSLDEPGVVAPREQIGIESRVPWWHGMEALPGKTTAEDAPELVFDDLQYSAPSPRTG